MPSRLFGISSRSPKEREAKAGEAAHQSRGGGPPELLPHYSPSEIPPPDYKAGSSYDYADVPPNYTAGFANLDLSDAPSSENPTVDETIAHLKTLECFYRLRKAVSSTDGLFGIYDATVMEIPRSSSLANSEGADELLLKLAEKRWAIYVSRAVDRFHAWIFRAAPAVIIPTLPLPECEGTRYPPRGPEYFKTPMRPIGASNMPPVDVLMVWHAYMLNPRAYLEDCIRSGRRNLWNTRFPWSAITQCIDSYTFVFRPGAEAEANFVRLTGRHVSASLIPT